MVFLTSVKDTNEDTIKLTGDDNVLVRYHSTARATMDVEADGDAVIDLDMCSITNSGHQQTGALTFDFYNVEDDKFYFGAKDSEDRYYSTKHTAEMIDYVHLTGAFESGIVDGEGKITVACSGNFFDGSFGVMSNKLSIYCEYKEVGATRFLDGGYATITTYGNGYYASVPIVGLDYQKSYVFQFEISDVLETIYIQKTITSKPLFHWGKDNFMFEIPVEFTTGPVVVTCPDDYFKVNGLTQTDSLRVFGDVVLKGDGNYGNKLKFGDGDYCYIAELSDDALTIKASNGVYINGVDVSEIHYGNWTPSFSLSMNSYTECRGWYNKVGNTVTVGFYIKANCPSNNEDVPIMISGLPYTPVCSAAGGGMCSGAYVSAGFSFQCFVAGTNGNITTRVQSLNTSASGNLSTSAQGCWYRKGGGEITVSGTITYSTNE